jgi:hypothetical protein
LLRRLAPRNDVDRFPTHLRLLAARCARGLQIHSAPKRRGRRATLKRGRREDRVHAAPAVPCAKVTNKNAHEHTGSAETLRPSLRDGVTAYSVLSPARPELVCHRRPCDAKHHHELDTSHRGVRTTRLRRPRTLALVFSQTPRPPHPAARVVTCATPLSSGGMESF